jgi:hypothetical protein
VPSHTDARADSTVGYREPPPIARGLAFFVVGLVALHVTITFFFNAPANPIKDAARGEINGYMQPFFGQNWSLFAPNPINSEDTVLVRARVADDVTGEERVTEWVNATEREWTLVHHSLAPSRASRLSSNLHRRLHDAWGDLSADQQDIVARDFDAMPDWQPLADALIDAQGGETSSTVANVVRGDRVATGYATQVARALWGPDVTAVQFRLQRTPVPRWNDRFEPEPEDPPATTREFGWRPVLVNEGQSDGAFATTFEGLEP